jgi:hypothetical protein
MIYVGVEITVNIQHMRLTIIVGSDSDRHVTGQVYHAKCFMCGTPHLQQSAALVLQGAQTFRSFCIFHVVD